MNILLVGDLLIGSDRCRDELDIIAHRYGVSYELLDWETGNLEGLRKSNKKIEIEGPSSVDPPAKLRELIKHVHLLIVHFCPVSASLIESAPNLKVVGTLRTGLANIDVQAAENKGIEVIDLPGRLADAVSDLAIGLILALTRGIVRTHEALRQGEWSKNFGDTDDYFELQGRIVGLIGFGEIGKKVAHKLSNFDVEILACDPYISFESMQEYGVQKVELDTLLSKSDVVSIHTSLSEATIDLIGANEIARMKSSSYLVNTARAEIINKQALLDSLIKKSIAGAALDVFWEEPIDNSDPFLRLENVVITPHLGGTLKDTLMKSFSRLNERLRPYYERLSNQM